MGRLTSKREDQAPQQESPRPSLPMAGLQHITVAQSNEQPRGPSHNFQDDFPVSPSSLALSPSDESRRDRSHHSWLILPVRDELQTAAVTTPPSSDDRQNYPGNTVFHNPRISWLARDCYHTLFSAQGGGCTFPTINLSQSRCRAGPWGDSHTLQELEGKPRV